MPDPKDVQQQIEAEKRRLLEAADAIRLRRQTILSKYEQAELVAVMWSDGMAARFPNMNHGGCRQINGQCYGWHCNRCGVPTSYQGHNDCPDRPEGVSGA